MEKPKCRLCGERHWGSCMANGMANTVKSVANKAETMANTEKSHTEIIEDSASVSHIATGGTYRYRDAEKRRAYMREYMRNRRAK